MSEYFPKPKLKVELNLSNYATKADLRKATSVGTSKFAKKVDLASFKSEVDEVDSDKLEKILTDLNSLKSV